MAYLAVRDHGAKPDMIINFNPALDRWRVADVPAVETIHSDGDRWVWLSQWLPGHIWGDQGKRGIGPVAHRKVEHYRFANHRAKDFRRMAYDDHNGAFAPGLRQHWASFVAARITGVLSGIPRRETDRMF